jgi:hypothetical protein
MDAQSCHHSVHHSLYVILLPHAAEFVVTYVIRVGRNGFVWTNYVLSCHASIPRNGCPSNRPSGVCLFLPCLGVLMGLQVSVGVVMAVFKPAFPAVLPNPQNVLQGMIATQCSIGAAAPTFLEARDRFFVGTTMPLSGVHIIGLVAQPCRLRLSQNHEGGGMFNATIVVLCNSSYIP